MGIVVIILGIILLICSIIGVIKSDKAFIVGVISGVTLIVLGLFVILEPTKKDVLDGKAIYQETIHITNNDTIKTYEIVWKQKN